MRVSTHANIVMGIIIPEWTTEMTPPISSAIFRYCTFHLGTSQKDQKNQKYQKDSRFYVVSPQVIQHGKEIRTFCEISRCPSGTLGPEGTKILARAVSLPCQRQLGLGLHLRNTSTEFWPMQQAWKEGLEIVYSCPLGPAALRCNVNFQI